jgi:hypothetical protein
MPMIVELKVDELRVLLRARNLASSGSRAELVQWLMEHEQSEEIEMPTVGLSSQQEDAITSQAAAISQLQGEMRELKNMMAQLVSMQTQNTAVTGQANQPINQQNNTVVNTEVTSNERSCVGLATSNNMRQASVKEIANTLPEFDPSDDNAISVDQFVDRVNKVVDAYLWDEKFLMLAIYSRLKGPAKMWLDSSPILHTTWNNFANALRDEFGANPDEAEVHFSMASATRRPKETVKEYCFRMSALGVRYRLSEAAVIRYVRAGLQHRELQNSIAAIHVATMKELRDAAESYFINRGRSNALKKKVSYERRQLRANAGQRNQAGKIKGRIEVLQLRRVGSLCQFVPKREEKDALCQMQQVSRPNSSLPSSKSEPTRSHKSRQAIYQKSLRGITQL